MIRAHKRIQNKMRIFIRWIDAVHFNRKLRVPTDRRHKKKSQILRLVCSPMMFTWFVIFTKSKTDFLKRWILQEREKNTGPSKIPLLQNWSAKFGRCSKMVRVTKYPSMHFSSNRNEHIHHNLEKYCIKNTSLCNKRSPEKKYINIYSTRG